MVYNKTQMYVKQVRKSKVHFLQPKLYLLNFTHHEDTRTTLPARLEQGCNLTIVPRVALVEKSKVLHGALLCTRLLKAKRITSHIQLLSYRRVLAARDRIVSCICSFPELLKSTLVIA